MSYVLIYDGLCNLCSTLVQWLEKLDHGNTFRYVPMQDSQALATWNITTADCDLGMILLDENHPEQRWQGSAAVEEVARILPAGAAVIAAYRSIPGLKWAGDKGYEQVRDHRYDWFGKRQEIYQSNYPFFPEDCQVCQR